MPTPTASDDPSQQSTPRIKIPWTNTQISLSTNEKWGVGGIVATIAVELTVQVLTSKSVFEPAWNLITSTAGATWYAMTSVSAPIGIMLVSLALTTLIIIAWERGWFSKESHHDWTFQKGLYEGIDWEWEWENDTPVRLRPLCPDCGYELATHTISTTIPTQVSGIIRVYDHSLECNGPKCEFEKKIDCNREELQDRARREVERRRRKGLLDTNS